ncbi:hypothetical protein LINPERPRIM_LOCUS29125 [Linum perenne]
MKYQHEVNRSVSVAEGSEVNPRRKKLKKSIPCRLMVMSWQWNYFLRINGMRKNLYQYWMKSVDGSSHRRLETYEYSGKDYEAKAIAVKVLKSTEDLLSEVDSGA